ncbi:MAG: hypothetical protein E7577_07365 [Ruminococcaceae bacterium]|nr:hypothetical protein [Oscillospiraceae bacterium]
MTEKKYRCSKCGAFEVVFVDRSADPFNTKPPRFVCQKCGCEYELDSGISVMNRNTINTFPCPERDLDIDDPFTAWMKERIKSMREPD